jgi:DNA-binding beta-propeller fold protein YncE
MGYYLTFFMLAVGLLLPGRMQAAEPITQQFDTLSAQVTNIDKATHTLTLLNDRNETIILQVDPAKVKRFDEIKVGQNVVIRERRSVALSLEKEMKEGEKPTAGAAMTTEKAPPGEHPSMTAEKTENIRGEIVAIDKTKNLVTLKGPKGNLVSVLAKDPSRLAGLKVGDKVWATYTVAMAISVEPAPQQP